MLHVFLDVRHPVRGISFILISRDGRELLHVFVDVERIGLLRKVVRPHRATHLCRFVFWLTEI